jgi:hypothetical protein
LLPCGNPAASHEARNSEGDPKAAPTETQTLLDDRLAGLIAPQTS